MHISQPLIIPPASKIPVGAMVRGGRSLAHAGCVFQCEHVRYNVKINTDKVE